MRILTNPRAVLGAVALVFLVSHVACLAPTLEDIDSVNFALGVQQYDVPQHQPHPPGYPLFIALAKLSTAVVRQVSGPEPVVTAHAARGLAIWGAVLGALSVFPLYALFRAVERSAPVALAATTLAVACPMFWFNASRPMSDIPGLAFAFVSQALLITAFVRQREAARRADGQAITRDDLVASGTAIVAGAFVAGLAIGMRTQTLWLTAPLLALVLIDRVGRGAAGALLGALMTFTLGALVWTIPMLVATGGLTEYLSALGSQGREDFEDVRMLISHPTPAIIGRALVRTFLDLWGWLPFGIGVFAVSMIGGVVALGRSRRALLAMTCAYLPYALFHLAFHDTDYTRYAIPLIVPLVWLAVRALRVAGDRVAVIGTVAAAVLSIAIVARPLAVYAGAPSPVTRMLRALQGAIASGDGASRVLMMNHPFAVAWRGEALPIARVPTAIRKQWLQVVDYWRGGGTAPVWFIADPGPNGLDSHHELALMDPGSRRMLASERWGFAADPLLAGTRPSIADWHELQVPGWFATEGWSLTPELAGVANRDRRGPALGGISAWVRRRDTPVTVLVGGRNLGRVDEPVVRYTVTVDGRQAATWTVTPNPGFFVETFTLAPGQLAGAERFALLAITAEAADGSGAPVRTAVEQFDLQDPASVMVGFDTGWHEAEYSLRQGRLWRWTSDVSTLRVVTAHPQALTLTLRGESPLRYFDRAPTVRIMVGTRVVHSFSPGSDFTEQIELPAELDWTGGEARVRVETDLTFVPDERDGNGDRRRLGLRIYAATVAPSSTIVH